MGILIAEMGSLVGEMGSLVAKVDQILMLHTPVAVSAYFFSIHSVNGILM
jgi:hypothetical protein